MNLGFLDYNVVKDQIAFGSWPRATLKALKTFMTLKTLKTFMTLKTLKALKNIRKTNKRNEKTFNKH